MAENKNKKMATQQQQQQQRQSVVILGADGMVGTAMTAYFKTEMGAPNVVCVTRQHADLYSLYCQREPADPPATAPSLAGLRDAKPVHMRPVLYRFLESLIRPDTVAIINCAAVTGVRGPDEQCSAEETLMVNALFPLCLEGFVGTLRPDITLVHISTDEIFDGAVPDPEQAPTATGCGRYAPGDMCTAPHLYGMTKFLADAACKRTCIIRTNVIGDSIGNGRSLLEWCKRRQDTAVSGYVNHLWNGVTSVELAKYVHRMILTGTQWVGVRHLASSQEGVTHYRLLQMISDTYGLNLAVYKHADKRAVDRRLRPEFVTSSTLPEQLVELYKFYSM